MIFPQLIFDSVPIDQKQQSFRSLPYLSKFETVVYMAENTRGVIPQVSSMPFTAPIWGAHLNYPPDLISQRILSPDTGGLLATGQDAGFVRSSIIAASYGDFAVIGTDSGALIRIPAYPAGYDVSGQDAGFVYAGTTGLYADPGDFSISGKAVNFGISIVASTGVISLTGQSAGSIRSYSLNVQQGNFSISGFGASTLIRILAESCEFSLSGEISDFRYTRILQANCGSFGATGENINLAYNRIFGLSFADFILSGGAMLSHKFCESRSGKSNADVNSGISGCIFDDGKSSAMIGTGKHSTDINDGKSIATIRGAV